MWMLNTDVNKLDPRKRGQLVLSICEAMKR